MKVHHFIAPCGRPDFDLYYNVLVPAMIFGNIENIEPSKIEE